MFGTFKSMMFLTLIFLSCMGFAQAPPVCAVVVDPQVSQFKTGQVPQDKALYFRQVSQAIQSKQAELSKILLRFNNVAGTKLEFEIVKKQLLQELDVELYNINNTPALNNIAVYASTNVPLYTLVSHGLITKAMAKNVWFRTPETTREVYVDLLAVLKSAMPEGALDGLNLLVESRDVQYDNFNKMYVMGMNKKGTRLERPPSEMVIFTGNPETAQKIVETNARRIKEDAVRFNMAPFKQVFLGFGAGINPIIVPSSARTNLEQVVFQSMEPIRINNGQDCMAADFYAVSHDVVTEYTDRLVQEIKKLKPGLNTDANAGYTPLTMNKNFATLKAFKDKYKQYLKNPDATINEETKMVSPHVFVFPHHMFKEVELYEHFGPIFVVYSYKNATELQSMARDERVQNKAMYATVLGGNQASPDLIRAAEIFRETRHHVIVNNTLFGDIHPNMPFGGKGPQASMIVNLDYKGAGQLNMTTGHRPKLVSSEANTAFGSPQVIHKPALLTAAELRVELDRVLKLAALPATEVEFFDNSWKTLALPEYQMRPRGISELRKKIAEEGLFITTNDSVRTQAEKKDFYALHGASPIAVSTDSNTKIRNVKGVVLHPISVGETTSSLNQVRGTVNPHLGWGNLNGLLTEQKYLEYILAESVQPGSMPHTESFKTLKEKNVISENFLQQLNVVQSNLQSKALNNKILSGQERAEMQKQLTDLLELFFLDLRKWFPEGAYVKNFGEFGTADLGNQITSFATPPQAIASEFLRRFESSIAVNKKGQNFSSNAFQKLMKTNIWEIGTAFYNQMLLKPDQLLAQSRVKIAKTEMGFPIEVRVDFIDGEPLWSRVRFGTEYLPEETKEAAQFLKKFFEQAPEPLKYMSGGADIAKLMDGSWVFIEFNFGSASGTLSPGYFPVESNLLISNLSGKQTPFIQKLEGTFNGGLDQQIVSLKKRKYVRPLFWKAYGLDDLSVAEEGRYYRDRYLQEWTKNPTEQNAAITLENIKKMFSAWDQQEDIRNLILGAEYYIKRALK